MMPSELTGETLASLVDVTCESEGDREPLYRALLAEPLCVAHLGEDAPPGPQARIGDESVRLVEAPTLRVPVVPLYTSGTAMSAAGRARGYWPDGVERGSVLPPGEAFVRLRGHPGALLVAGEGRTVPLDAGELAALADKQTPAEYVAGIRALIQKNKGRDAARRLAGRPLYVLGHPKGGLLVFQREIPAFFHLSSADRFAARIAAQSGDRAEHGLVGAGDLFKNAFRGKLNLLLDPGPSSLTLKYTDLRV